MKQFRISRKIATVPIVAGSFATVDLPRSYDYEALFVRISGSLQVTVLATSVRAEAPCQLVPRLVVTADGKNNLFNAPFWATCLGNYERMLTQSGARATTPPSGVAVATYAVEAIGVIDFATINGVRPKDSNFRTSRLSLFQLQLTFGQPDDPFVGGTVVFSGTPTVEVWSAEMVEVPDIGADGKPNYTTPLMLKKVSMQEIAVLSSNANQEIRLPAGNLIKSVLVRTEGNTTAGEPSTAMLNNLQLANGVDVRWNLSGAQTRARNNADYGQLTGGYYVADLTTLGSSKVNLTDLWDLVGQVDPKAILDIVGGATNKVQAIVTEYIPAAA